MNCGSGVGVGRSRRGRGENRATLFHTLLSPSLRLRFTSGFFKDKIFH